LLSVILVGLCFVNDPLVIHLEINTPNNYRKTTVLREGGKCPESATTLKPVTKTYDLSVLNFVFIHGAGI